MTASRARVPARTVGGNGKVTGHTRVEVIHDGRSVSVTVRSYGKRPRVTLSMTAADWETLTGVQPPGRGGRQN